MQAEKNEPSGFDKMALITLSEQSDGDQLQKAKTILQDRDRLKHHILALKQERNQGSQQYVDHPKISLILQFFNRKEFIKSILKRLRAVGAEELIVIDDGSIDGSYEKWPKHLNQPNDFLLRSNDLYEVRMYERAISMARGEFVCLLQDDDLPEPKTQWIENALTLFKNYPKLLILGGRQGIELRPERTRLPFFKSEKSVRTHIESNPIYEDPKSGISFMFYMATSRAPMFIRRKEFMALGGIDQSFAPFQNDDVEICLRAWLNGYQVGFYKAPFLRNVANKGGMRLYNAHSSSVQDALNMKKICAKYGKNIARGQLRRSVEAANRKLRRRIVQI